MSTLQLYGWDDAVCTLGVTDIAACRKTAFLCSRRYPAAAVLRIYDWAKAARSGGECILSGFHSALERDVLEILLRGSQPIILAAARGLPKRYSVDVKRAIDAGRLLVISPFQDSVKRITADTARYRNAFMLSIAECVVVGHMNPDGVLADALHKIPADREVIFLENSP